MHWDIPLTSESQAKKKLRNATGRNTTWGVFKADVVFFFLYMIDKNGLQNNELRKIRDNTIALPKWSRS